MYEKTEGIVLRAVKYKDTDLLLTVLTKQFGKLTLRVRGAAGSRNKNKAACQLFAFSEFTLSEYQGKHTLTEAVSKELFPELQQELELYYLASYFLQVTDVAAQENDPMPELLSLLLNSLYALAKLRKPKLLVKSVFELRLACICGFLPDLRGCMICGRTDADCFNLMQGALQCADCSGKNTDGIRMPLSDGTREAMRYICRADAKRLFSFSLSEPAMRELNEITEAYLSTQLERGFSTLDLYKSLFI